MKTANGALNVAPAINGDQAATRGRVRRLITPLLLLSFGLAAAIAPAVVQSLQGRQ
jgi:hypothetical protein